MFTRLRYSQFEDLEIDVASRELFGFLSIVFEKCLP